MSRYLKKKKLYEIVSQLVGNDIKLCPCKDFVYSCWDGMEWIECREITITCQQQGGWIGVKNVWHDQKSKMHTDMDIYTDLCDGVYRRHYHNGELLAE